MSERKRSKGVSTKLALEIKAKDQIALERDEDGNPIKLIVTSAKMTADGLHIHVVGKNPAGQSQTHVVAWRTEVPLYLPPKKDRRYAFLLWLAKKLGAPVKRV